MQFQRQALTEILGEKLSECHLPKFSFNKKSHMHWIGIESEPSW